MLVVKAPVLKQGCADVDTIAAVVFVMSWKWVQKSSNTSRIHYQILFGLITPLCMVWRNSNLESNLDSGRSLETQRSDESDNILCFQLLIVEWLTFQLWEDPMLGGIWQC
jgi:hypothetical protein